MQTNLYQNIQQYIYKTDYTAEIMEDFDALVEDAEGGIEGESEDVEESEDYTEEEKEDLAEDAKETLDNVDSLSKTGKDLDEVMEPRVKKSFGDVVKETLLMGVILYGVNFVLQKLTKGSKSGKSGSSQQNNKLAKVKALAKLIKDVTGTSKTFLTWLTSKQDIQVKVEFGAEIPVTELLFGKIKPIKASMKAASTTARSFMNNDVKPATFNVPDDGAITKIIDSVGDFITAFKNCLDFAAEVAEKVPALKSCPVGQSDISQLNSDLSTLKQLPA